MPESRQAYVHSGQTGFPSANIRLLVIDKLIEVIELVGASVIKIKTPAQSSHLMLFENCEIDAVQKSLNRRLGNAAFFRVKD